MVILEKNQSCDVILYLPEGRTATKHDCWHADDPNCKLTPGLYREPGRGVFRLAPSEVEARDLRDRVIPQLRSEVAMLSRRFEDVLMNADSTRQLQDRPVRPMAGRFQKQEPAATAGS
jgi:hypothetical protein